eukprot:354069-Chlamydomonas_euryale.AAC.5
MSPWRCTLSHKSDARQPNGSARDSTMASICEAPKKCGRAARALDASPLILDNLGLLHDELALLVLLGWIKRMLLHTKGRSSTTCEHGERTRSAAPEE